MRKKFSVLVLILLLLVAGVLASCEEHTHSFGEWQLSVMATCSEKGMETRSCSCGETETREVEPHSWKYDYTFTDESHWIECFNCDEILKMGNHEGLESGSCSVCGATDRGVNYELSAEGEYAVVVGGVSPVAGGGNSRQLIILKDTYQGKPVKEICKEAFEESNVASIFIPSSVTHIGDDAFYSSHVLLNVMFGKNSQLIEIGRTAFYGCPLGKIAIPASVKSIKEGAFFRSGLDAVVFEEGCCATLDSLAFSETRLPRVQYENCNYLGVGDNPYFILESCDNKNFSAYQIHEKTKMISGGAFDDCERLSATIIPEGVVSIGEYSFSGCEALASIVLPNSLKGIGEHAFANCDSLTAITIPRFVTNIGAYAFSGALKSAVFENTSDWVVMCQYDKKGVFHIPETDLADPAKAAEHLKSIYLGYYWNRTVE